MNLLSQSPNSLEIEPIIAFTGKVCFTAYRRMVPGINASTIRGPHTMFSAAFGWQKSAIQPLQILTVANAVFTVSPRRLALCFVVYTTSRWATKFCWPAYKRLGETAVFIITVGSKLVCKQSLYSTRLYIYWQDWILDMNVIGG